MRILCRLGTNNPLLIKKRQGFIQVRSKYTLLDVRLERSGQETRFNIYKAIFIQLFTCQLQFPMKIQHKHQSNKNKTQQTSKRPGLKNDDKCHPQQETKITTRRTDRQLTERRPQQPKPNCSLTRMRYNATKEFSLMTEQIFDDFTSLLILCWMSMYSFLSFVDELFWLSSVLHPQVGSEANISQNFLHIMFFLKLLLRLFCECRVFTCNLIHNTPTCNNMHVM